MRRLLLVVLVLGACADSTGPKPVFVIPTQWTTHLATFPDGSVEGYYISAADSAGTVSLQYVCHTTGTPPSLTVTDQGSAGAMPTAVLRYEPRTETHTVAFAEAGDPARVQVVGETARTVATRAAGARTLDMRHTDGSRHRWGTQGLAVAMRTSCIGAASGVASPSHDPSRPLPPVPAPRP